MIRALVLASSPLAMGCPTSVDGSRWTGAVQAYGRPEVETFFVSWEPMCRPDDGREGRTKGAERRAEAKRLACMQACGGLVPACMDACVAAPAHLHCSRTTETEWRLVGLGPDGL